MRRSASLSLVGLRLEPARQLAKEVRQVARSSYLVRGVQRDRERRDIGGASGNLHLGARLDLGFKGLISAGTPNVSTLALGIARMVACHSMPPSSRT
jgi:hypothetical protein